MLPNTHPPTGLGVCIVLLLLCSTSLAVAQKDPGLFRRRWDARAQVLAEDPAWRRLMITDALQAFRRIRATYRQWDDSTALTLTALTGRSYARADSQTCVQIQRAGPGGLEILLNVDSLTAEEWVAWVEWVMRRGLTGPPRPVAPARLVDSVRTAVEQRVRARNPGVGAPALHELCALDAQFMHELVALPANLAGAVIRAAALGVVPAGVTDPHTDTLFMPVSGDTTPVLAAVPTVVRCPSATYPPALRAARIQGRVVLQFIVDTLGRAEPTSVQPVESPHDSLTYAARRMVLGCEFTPTRVRGRAVRVLVRLPLDFKLPAAAPDTARRP